MFKTIQSGNGADRDVFLGYFTASPDLAHVLGPDACYAIDVDDTGGRLARSLPPIADVVAELAKEHGFTPRSVIVWGWSAGCQALRSHLRAGEHADAWIACDGAAGRWPIHDEDVEPWRELVDGARAGAVLFALSHTFQTYTERLPASQAFASTVSIARLATGLELAAGGPPSAPVVASDGLLRVYSCASKSIDGTAHLEQQRTVLPLILRTFVLPWLAGHVHAEPSSPPADIPSDFAGRALARAQAHVGTREVPPNGGPFVAACFSHTRRGGHPTGLTSGDWCAAFVALCEAEAALPGEVVPEGRAAVHELVEDAKSAGKLHLAGSGYVPKPGDLAIRGRAGESPLAGGHGHVQCVETFTTEADYVTIDGNHEDSVARVTNTDPPLAWIER